MSTKLQILTATITCIERKGLHKTTSRDIAAEAGVNLAAINYHFGTKKKLIDQAMMLTIDNGMEDFSAILLAPDRRLRARLRDFYAALLSGGQKYPNITRAHLYDAVINGGPPGPYLERLQALLQQTLDTVTADDTILEREDLARAMETAMHAILLRCLHPNLFDLSPHGASGVEAEARRLVRLIPE